MHNWSLVCFTLFTQSAIGLIWVRAAGRWFAGGTRTEFSLWPMVVALALTILGLSAASTHLGKPRLAPYVLRNLAASWVSREVFLVPAFAGTVALIILLSLRDTSAALVILETAACLLGGAVLFAMTRVYLIETVPVWNSPATPLEFAGSAILLGSAFGAVLTSLGAADKPDLKPEITAAGIGILLGFMLKVLAIPPALSAEREARAQTWYAPTAETPGAGQTWMVRMGLYLIGLVFILTAMNEYGLSWLWSCFCLICLGTGEVIGRLRFYKAYGRIGL